MATETGPSHKLSVPRLFVRGLAVLSLAAAAVYVVAKVAIGMLLLGVICFALLGPTLLILSTLESRFWERAAGWLPLRGRWLCCAAAVIYLVVLFGGVAGLSLALRWV
jgi:hypothetical protein